MKPPSTKTLLHLILTTMLALILIQQYHQNKELKRTLESLNASFESQRHTYRQQRDSLQLIITAQEKQQENLKETISNLEKTKATINKEYHEKQTSILRIRAIDSLYDEVARHYRR